ncbi:MAG: toprim domain-containing protein [Candidatus Harrisonbacteria bacterium]|nr:toprim domain-containing protein [Candidatus Harrisonbacteria bacterium]
MLPESIKKLAAQLSNLPGIGPRQAIRIAIAIAGQKKERTQQIGEALQEVSRLSRCSRCFLPHGESAEFCTICSDGSRDRNLLAIVEKETDLLSLEQSGAFLGRYFIFGEINRDGSMNPEQENRLRVLKDYLKEEKIQEIILALSPTSYGDRAAELLESSLKGLAGKISRLGRGVPTGADLEFADTKTLSDALKNRS